jgi:hypothetical protein
MVGGGPSILACTGILRGSLDQDPPFGICISGSQSAAPDPCNVTVNWQHLWKHPPMHVPHTSARHIILLRKSWWVFVSQTLWWRWHGCGGLYGYGWRGAAWYLLDSGRRAWWRRARCVLAGTRGPDTHPPHTGLQAKPVGRRTCMYL